MILFDYIIKIMCNIIYFFLKFKKNNKNKVVFISRLNSKKSLDFILIEQKLLEKEENIECIFLCKKIDKFTTDFIGNVIYTLKCLEALANAKVCVTDSYTIAVSSVKHKKSLKIIQIWHSMGAIKKFGYQTVGKVSGRDKSTAKILNMHANYDYIISGSKAMTKYFSKAFNYPESVFLNYGLPRIDYLLENEKIIKEKIAKEYPKLNKKQNILYAPTFRTTKDDKTEDLIKNIDFNKYNLIIKGHANQELQFSKENIFECPEFTALELICICDYLITDYSAIAIEAVILNKKTLYYVYDYDIYKKNNGLNIDLFKEMSGAVFKTAVDIKKYLEKENYNKEFLLKYKNKYIDVQDGSSTIKICNLIKKCLEAE